METLYPRWGWLPEKIQKGLSKSRKRWGGGEEAVSEKKKDKKGGPNFVIIQNFRVKWPKSSKEKSNGYKLKEKMLFKYEKTKNFKILQNFHSCSLYLAFYGWCNNSYSKQQHSEILWHLGAAISNWEVEQIQKQC